MNCKYFSIYSESLKENQSNKQAHEHKNKYFSTEEIVKRNKSLLKVHLKCLYRSVYKESI